MELKVSRKAMRELEMLQRAESLNKTCAQYINAVMSEQAIENLQTIYIKERRFTRRFGSKTYLAELGRKNMARIEDLLGQYQANTNGDYVITTHKGFRIVKLRDIRYAPPYRVEQGEYVYGYYESVDDAKESIDKFRVKK